MQKTSLIGFARAKEIFVRVKPAEAVEQVERSSITSGGSRSTGRRITTLWVIIVVVLLLLDDVDAQGGRSNYASGGQAAMDEVVGQEEQVDGVVQLDAESPTPIQEIFLA